jgi:hypothetical protein
LSRKSCSDSLSGGLIYEKYTIRNRLHVRRINAYVGGKARRKIPLGRPRCRWEDYITMDLREIGWGGMDWIDLAQDGDQCRVLVNTVMNLRVA